MCKLLLAKVQNETIQIVGSSPVKKAVGRRQTIQTGQRIFQKGTDNVKFPHWTQVKLQLAFKINKVKIVCNITKKPPHCNAYFTHGRIVQNHLWSELNVFKRGLKVNTQRVCRITIKTKRMPMMKRHPPKLIENACLLEHCAVVSFTFKGAMKVCN